MHIWAWTPGGSGAVLEGWWVRAGPSLLALYGGFSSGFPAVTSHPWATHSCAPATPWAPSDTGT